MKLICIKISLCHSFLKLKQGKSSILHRRRNEFPLFSLCVPSAHNIVKYVCRS